MARRYDPFDEEYEGTTPEPFGQMTPSYEQEQAQLREQRRIRDLALSQPVAPDPATTYTPDMYDYQFAPTPAMTGPGSAGFQPWSNIGRKTTTGMQDRWDPFGNQDPFGGGMVSAGSPQTQTLPFNAQTLDFGAPSDIIQNLSQFAGGAAAAPTFSPAFSAASTCACKLGGAPSGNA